MSNGGNFSEIGTGRGKFKFGHEDKGRKIRAALGSWKEHGSGLVAYLSPSGTNDKVRSLKITPRNDMCSSEPFFVGWFSM